MPMALSDTSRVDSGDLGRVAAAVEGAGLVALHCNSPTPISTARHRCILRGSDNTSGR
jgi:hypothetical protein